MTPDEIALELELQKRRQGAFGGAPVETPTQGAFGTPSLSDAGPLPGEEWRGYDPETGRQFLRMVEDTAVNAADPFNIPSAVVGALSPEARDAWRLRQEQSHPVARGVGQALGPTGVAGSVLRAARSLPSLMAAGGVLGAGSDVIDQTAGGVEGAVGPNTALKGTMGSLGLSATAMPTKALLGMGAGGAGLAAADVARGGVGGSGERIDIGTAEARIADIKARLGEIEAQKIANGKDKRLSPARTSEINGQLEAEKIRLEKEGERIVGSISGERRAREMENAPLRERYPLATLGATVASLPLAFGLAKGGLNQIAAGLNEKVGKATRAATEARATDFIRDAEAARSLARSAPFKSAAVVGASGMVPAEVQMLPDLLDYKTMPRDSRAFKEAEKTFQEPGTYIKSIAVPAIGGLVSAGTAFAKSDMMKNSGMADAKALAGSLRGMDKRLSTEGKAQEWATRAAKAKDAESDLVEANLRNAEARAKKPAEAAPRPTPPAMKGLTADELADKLKGLPPPKREFVPGKRPDDPEHGRVHALREDPEVQKSVAAYVAKLGKNKVTGPDVKAALKEMMDMSDAQATRVAWHLRKKDDFGKLLESERAAIGKARGSRDGKAALEAIGRTRKETE